LALGGPPAKPAIAAAVIDAAWQRAPEKNGTSGVARFTYVEQSYDLERSLADFHTLIPFRKLAVVVDENQLRAIPELGRGAAAAIHKMGADAAIVPAGSDADSILARVPADVDAVYLAPLPGVSESALRRLLSGVNARRLPTLSYETDPDLPAGALASYEPAENWQRRARRVAVDIQRVLAGEDASTLPVRLVSAPRLTLNVATARTIAFSPSRTLLTEAVLVGTDALAPRDTLSLASAMRVAASTNLDILAARLDAAAGLASVRLAQSNLLPRIDGRVTQTFTRSSTAEASFGTQPEREGDAGLSLQLPLYSERAWAGYGSEQSLQQGREAKRDQLRLDVVLDVGTAYVSLLRAKSLAAVRRTNLERTRSNLEIARLREGVGSSSRADVYRWEGEGANARRDVIAADAQVREAALMLNRLLDRPLESTFATPVVSPGNEAFLMQDSTVLAWLDQPERLASLTRVLTGEASRLSSEIAQIDAGLAAQRRQHVAATRAFWLPDFTLQGGLTNVLHKDGAGSTGPALPPQLNLPAAPDMSWQFRLQASIPVFSGFSRQATREQASLTVQRLEIQRRNAELAVDQRVRTAVEAASASYAAIALGRAAADAAGRNYDLVSDAYGRGAVSITSLIDAQTAALNAAQGATNAIHDFLLDLLRLERSVGTFGVLLNAAERQAFLERLQSLHS
jgi:outer membrane protein TolC